MLKEMHKLKQIQHLGTNVFKVVEEAIKQMKRLQNPRMVNGDDKNDRRHGRHGTSR